MPARPTLGPLLRTVRKTRSLTLTQVAQRTGINIASLSEAERDKTPLTYASMVKLVKVLRPTPTQGVAIWQRYGRLPPRAEAQLLARPRLWRNLAA